MSRGRPARATAWLALAMGLGLAGACFSAPQPAVQFSCDPEQAPACPEGYRCEPDGCCHLEGTDYAMYEGQCQLGSIPLPTSGADSTTEPATDASTTLATTTDVADDTTTATTAGGATDSSSGSSSATTTSSSTGDASSGSTSSG